MNGYNQAPHLTQDTNGKVTTSQCASVHNFVPGMQSFLFQRVLGCNSIADLSLKIVFLESC